MSAEILREAAALMRADATSAAATLSWEWRSKDGATWWSQQTRAGRYIQSMSPAVALAVADWLDLAASDAWAWGPMCPCDDGCNECDDKSWEHHGKKALAVARAYLGESS